MALSKDNSFRKGFYHLQLAKEFFEDVVRDSPNTKAEKKSKRYAKTIDGIMLDYKTDPFIPKDAVERFTDDVQNDSIAYHNIADKCLGLTVDEKENVELWLDAILKGKKVKIEIEE